MPRIDDLLLDSVIYIYQSTDDAENGEQAGGTGFLVSIQSEVNKEIGYMYAITNSHVIKENSTPAIRFNDTQGRVKIINTYASDWTRHPDKADMAAICIFGDLSILKHCCIPTNMFLTEELINAHNIGPGDDTFMIGRFIQHDGKQKNLPSVRFGNISMMPHEKVKQQNGHEQDCFLVESRSLSGFSGSPVFVHINTPFRPEDKGALKLGGARGPWLLGIDCGHLPIYENLKIRNGNSITDIPNEAAIPKNLVINTNSGQMTVLPAWKLHDFLFNGVVAEARKKEESKLTSQIDK